MLPTFLLVISMILVCTGIHYEALRLLNKPWRIFLVKEQTRVAFILLGGMASHLIQILLFALAYFLLRDKFGFGNFGGQFRDDFTSFLYFSSETYTSVGFGDIYPLGLLRMLSSIETLIGLLMISWTASYTYLEMSRHWVQKTNDTSINK